jgi:hypothetical protein
MNTNGVRYIGTTDDTTECEKCGRTELRATVVLEWLDADGNGTGDVAYYGSSCAARELSARTGRRTTGAKVLDLARFAARETTERAAAAADRLALYSGPDTVDIFRDRNRQWGTELRSVEWATTSLAEMRATWERDVAEGALLTR